MVAPSGTAPISRAIVQLLKSNTDLKSALTGGIHEDIAPEGSAYPFLTYRLHYGTLVPNWGDMDIRAGYNIYVWSRDQVEARNLDQLVHETLWDGQLSVPGQSVLYCRRALDLSSADVDGQGQKVYSVGGLYKIMTNQTL